jgi:putative ABC transport system permease protein
MISFFSSLIPIVRVSKISIKDIILNNISRTKENGKKKFSNIILGSFLLIIIIMVQVVNNPKSKALAISTDLVAIISIISLAIILIPIINTAFSNILCKLNGFIFGNEGIIAGKNLKNDKNILNNISLLCISISTLFMINVISVTASQEIAKAYNSWNCDIVMYVNENSTLGDVENSRIKNTKNVSDALGVYGVYNTEVIGKNKEINLMTILIFNYREGKRISQKVLMKEEI